MTEEPSERETEDVDLFVVDPDDYQKTKKLESIHKAKQDVMKKRRNRYDLIPELSSQYRDEGHEIFSTLLAQTVANYGTELLPLIEQGLREGALTEADMESVRGVDVRDFTELDGGVHDADEVRSATEKEALDVYRQLDRIQQKLGLGLELEADQGPAEI